MSVSCFQMIQEKQKPKATSKERDTQMYIHKEREEMSQNVNKLLNLDSSTDYIHCVILLMLL